jgi:type IV pilus assembly protein PilP
MARARPQRLGFVVMAAAVMVAGGCSDDQGDLKDFVKRIKSRPGGKIEPLPEFEPYESFEYAPEQVRNPFVPSDGFAEEESESEGAGEKKAESELAPNKDRPKEPLEQFPLDSLRMVGTLTRDGNRWGLIKDPKGTIHRIRPGNHMGQNYGRVVTVKPETVRVVELIPDGDGGWRERKAAVAIDDR